MTSVLIVDDSPVDRQLASGLLDASENALRERAKELGVEIAL